MRMILDEIKLFFINHYKKIIILLIVPILFYLFLLLPNQYRNSIKNSYNLGYNFIISLEIPFTKKTDPNLEIIDSSFYYYVKKFDLSDIEIIRTRKSIYQLLDLVEQGTLSPDELKDALYKLSQGNKKKIENIFLINIKNLNNQKAEIGVEGKEGASEKIGNINKVISNYYSNLANVNSISNNANFAFLFYENALSIDQDNIDAKKGLAYQYHKNNSPDKSIAKYLDAIEQAKNNNDDLTLAKIIYELAYVYEQNKMIDQAFDNYTKSLEMAKELKNRQLKALNYTRIAYLIKLRDKNQNLFCDFLIKAHREYLKNRDKLFDQKIEYLINLGKCYN